MVPSDLRCPTCGWHHCPLALDTNLLTWGGEQCGDSDLSAASGKADRAAQRAAQAQARREAKEAHRQAWLARGGRRAPLGPYNKRRVSP